MTSYVAIDIIIILQIWIFKGAFSFDFSTTNIITKPTVSLLSDLFPNENSTVINNNKATPETHEKITALNNNSIEERIEISGTRFQIKNFSDATFGNNLKEAQTKSLNTFSTNETNLFVGGYDENLDESINKSTNTTLINCTSESGLPARCNYSSAENGSETENGSAILGTASSVAVAAGICLVSAIIGYLGCVGYRRYLLYKYENTKMVAPEDVYDTTDLRYFEI